MCAKTRKRKTRKAKKTKGSLFTIFLVFVILSMLAAAIAFFFYDIGKTKSIIQPKVPAKTKTVAKQQDSNGKSMLEGSWVSNTDGRILEIHGTSFTLELPSVSDHEIIKGKILISGNTATIVYSGTKDKCAEHPGTYSFVMDNESIHFSVKHDNCEGRKQIFSTTWEKF